MSRVEMLRALAARTNKPLHHYGLAMELRSAGDLTGARDVFAQIHQLDRCYVPAYFMRAQTLDELGQAGEARAALGEGIAIAEQSGDDHAAREMREMLETL